MKRREKTQSMRKVQQKSLKPVSEVIQDGVI